MRHKFISLLALLPLCSCTSKTPDPTPEVAEPVLAEPAPTPPTTPMSRDVDRICHSEEYSGALDVEPSQRAMHAGIWLATNIESIEGRALSAKLSTSTTAERIAQLRAELKKHQIGKCEILSTWGDTSI